MMICDMEDCKILIVGIKMIEVGIGRRDIECI